MTLWHNKVLSDYINKEIAGTDYICIDEDKLLLDHMMSEINQQYNTNIQYLAEIDTFHIDGAGEIISKYIKLFTSEAVKGYLLPNLVLNKTTNCDKLIIQLYSEFRQSGEYISQPNEPAPAHIYVRYDNAFRQMKSKRIAEDLLSIVASPRDAYYLPLSVRMLASWKIQGLEKILLKYLMPDSLFPEDVGLPENNESYFPSFSCICRELRFTAINGLQYYPTTEALDMLYMCLSDVDPDIQLCAKKLSKK